MYESLVLEELCSYFFSECGITFPRMNALGIGSCLVAALCHDVGHPGRNNNFFVAEMSALVRSIVSMKVFPYADCISEGNSCCS